MENKLVAFIKSTSFLDKRFELSGYEFEEHGTHNGYVAVPPQNKYHGKSINDMEDIEVHGGVTFSEPATYPEVMNGRKINEKYVGKRNAILEQAVFITENTEVGDDWWIFGFDTSHCDDNKYDWDERAVIEETFLLMGQLNRG